MENLPELSAKSFSFSYDRCDPVLKDCTDPKRKRQRLGGLQTRLDYLATRFRKPSFITVL
ncbi:hypothetical protein A343_1723 [Porphyromonas gingivalis JCVI SC001]|nr:hypothetical protein A343_1723 [Porphyromonas gingivalis JCVI SC001]